MLIIVCSISEYIEEITDLAEAEPVEMSVAARDASIVSAVRMINVLPSAIGEKAVYIPKSQNVETRRDPANFTIAMGNTVQSQKAVRSASMKSSNLLSLMASVAAQSAIASARQSSTSKQSSGPEPTVNEAWHEKLKAVPFSSIKEEDVITWINVESIQKPEGRTPQWMLNPCRKMCVFVTFSVNNKGHRVPQYLCNFCRLTETTYSGILQHLNHHLFVCGICPFYSATRFDVELHRQRVGHMQPLSDGYIVHKQGTSVSSQKLRNSKSAQKRSISTLLEWLPIQEETESLIIMDADKPPDSAHKAFFQCNPLATTSEIEGMVTSTSVVCALPYYRYVAGKSNRKHVLEFHCNFCQSTPTFTQELYRHIDFHALDCPEEGCEYRCFTRLELHLHQRHEHADKAKEFLDDLVVLVPLVPVSEDSLVENASMYHAKWSVVLELPNITEVPGSGDYCQMRNMTRESEYRCTICNLYTINKGGMSRHLKMHNVSSKDMERYMEPI